MIGPNGNQRRHSNLFVNHQRWRPAHRRTFFYCVVVIVDDAVGDTVYSILTLFHSVAGSINSSIELAQPITVDGHRSPPVILGSMIGDNSSAQRRHVVDADVTSDPATDAVLPLPVVRHRSMRSITSTPAAVAPPRPPPTPLAANLAAVPPTSGDVLFPVTFRTPDVHVMTKMKIYSTFSIHFKVNIGFRFHLHRWKMLAYLLSKFQLNEPTGRRP
jgi:hypothetical protein